MTAVNGAQSARPVQQPVQTTESNAGRMLFSEAMTDQTFQVPQQAANGMLPSIGSALHGTGKCLPCAWFWKPKGCQNAANCQYCHMCPEGELKARKKAKVNAIRMGALLPASAQPGTTTATLKLSTLVQAQ